MADKKQPVAARSQKHILSVSYDEALLRTRQLLLERHSYRVTSALGFQDAEKRCRLNGHDSYDLFVLGHSIPQSDKNQLIRIFREHCPAPVLSLLRHLETGAKDADYHVPVDNPQELLHAVDGVLVLNGFLLRVLDDAMGLTGADFGNIQVIDFASSSLRIVAQRGFGPAFLEFFSVVREQGSACGQAMQCLGRVISEDVASDPIYTESARRVMLASQARACQSTPMVAPSGRLVGILSTHYKAPGKPREAALVQLDRMAAAAGDWVSRELAALKPWPKLATNGI